MNLNLLKILSFFKKHYFITFLLGFSILFFMSFNYFAADQLKEIYLSQQSQVIKDRHNNIISINPNNKDYYALYQNTLPNGFKAKLMEKEDRFFLYHFGINPISILRGFNNLVFHDKRVGSSTITQQLVKNLLGLEQKRTIRNKVFESLMAISLEFNSSKEEILNMYANTVYLGNRIQGFSFASLAYYDSPLFLLNDQQQNQILNTLSSPSSNNPWTNKQNKSLSEIIDSSTTFELKSLGLSCQNSCQLTIDEKLTQQIRGIVKRQLETLVRKDAYNGAVVVIKLPENELLAIVGSPDPNSNDKSHQVNMAIKPRAIGSTVKPFIYLGGFEKELRPYSLVDDREYKYMIGTGFPLYPKNFDYEYRGEVTLAYSLANSLNVPTLKVLEYVGLNDFYDFFQERLGFQAQQDMEKYQLGIALGTLEMDLLSLSQYFSIFGNDGILKPIIIRLNTRESLNGNMVNLDREKQIAEKSYIQLINKILSDRYLGIEEFSLKNNLSLPQQNYAVKTGTSKDFRDSWTIGYTPDYLVGVWLGNSDYKGMNQVTGEAGAGRIWNEVMQLLFNSKYNKETPFDHDLIEEYQQNYNIEYGLKGDNYQKNRYLLIDNDLILNPFDGDLFLLEDQVQIPLESSLSVDWYVNDQYFETGQRVIFEPYQAGTYKIRAKTEADSALEETVTITLKLEN